MNNKKLKMKVNGIHCEGCSNKIKKGVSEISSDSKVNVDVKTGHVEVEFNSSSISTKDIKNKIENVGFSIESMEIE